MEAKALYHFDATEDDELSFRKGDVLKVVDTTDQPWFRAQLDGKEGLVPSCYIKMKQHKWYSGYITKKDAEEQLKDKTVNGSFLIREGAEPSVFWLSVKLKDGVAHLKILQRMDGKYFIGMTCVCFSSVNQLVHYYRKVFISRPQGICLTEPLEEEESQKVQALYDFEPQEEGELRMKKGDIVTVLDKVDENWWEGTCEGRSGLFPAPYVMIMDRHTLAHTQKVQALYDFEPQEEGELRMKKGDIVTVLEKVDQNWWKGEFDGRSGLFPVPYVEEVES